MGSNSSQSRHQDQIQSSPKGNLKQIKLSPNKAIFNSNWENMRAYDSTLPKNNSVNQSQNRKTQVNEIQKNTKFISDTIKYDIKFVQQTSNLMPSNSQNCINLQINQNLYQDQKFLRTLWSFLLNQPSDLSLLGFQQFSQLILVTLQAIKLKFCQKLQKTQIYPIFSSNQQTKDFEKDIQIFELALKNRVFKYFSVTQKHPCHLGVQKYKQQTKETIKTLGNAIICQLMGKTSIWRSLMFLKQQQQQKVMQMLEKQGIDRMHLREISQAKIV